MADDSAQLTFYHREHLQNICSFALLNYTGNIFSNSYFSCAVVKCSTTQHKLSTVQLKSCCNIAMWLISTY